MFSYYFQKVDNLICYIYLVLRKSPEKASNTINGMWVKFNNLNSKFSCKRTNSEKKGNIISLHSVCT